MEIRDDHVFFDERTTGKKNRRAGFQSLMRAVANDDVDTIIIFSTSRLFRRTYRTLQFAAEEIVDRRKRVVFVKSGPIDSDDRDDFAKLLHVHSLVDELQVQMQAAHIRAAHEGLLRLGVVFGTLTYGFGGQVIEGQLTRLGKPARKLCIDEEAAKWVRRIFSWFVDDELSIAEIARRLNDSAAPLPQRQRVTRWTRLIVRRILDNPRYRGRWAYGVTEAVWQNKADYSRQYLREKPLAEIDLPQLRIIEDRTWHEAQKRLIDYRRRSGRKPKHGDQSQYPKLLNEICFCEKHLEQKLYVGGAYGKYLFCPQCRTDPQRALVSQLPRVSGTQQLCSALAQLIRSDEDVAARAVTWCRKQAEELQRPNPALHQDLRSEEQRLTLRIKSILGAPCETPQDEAENYAVLADLRGRRAQVQVDLLRLDEAMHTEIHVPSVEEARALLLSFADVLIESVNAADTVKAAAARRIVHALTGGRIVISQHGPASARQGWLRGTFKLRLLKSVLDEAGVAASHDADSGVEVHVDFRKRTASEGLADDAKELLDQNVLVKRIAEILSERRATRIGRAMVTKALRYWFTSRGLPVPDFRGRHQAINKASGNRFPYQSIADEVMDLVNQGALLDEIAQRLNVDRNTVTAAVRYWHERRGLPVPDGRTRRKSLERKSRPRRRASQPDDTPTT